MSDIRPPYYVDSVSGICGPELVIVFADPDEVGRDVAVHYETIMHIDPDRADQDEEARAALADFYDALFALVDVGARLRRNPPAYVPSRQRPE